MKPKTQKILARDTNAKTVKGQKKGFITGIVYLSPYNISGKNLCPKASAGCAASCLNTAGRGRFQKIQEARLKKTLSFLNDTETFVSNLKKEIRKGVDYAKKKEMIFVCRLNGTSDVAWYKTGNIMQDNSDVQFYDYTPNLGRMLRFLRNELPSNYHLTFSRKENNEAECDLVLSMGGNVAMVFNKIPTSYKGYEVINGDETDLRFLDKKGVIVGLKAKGKGKKDQTGFVIHL